MPQTMVNGREKHERRSLASELLSPGRLKKFDRALSLRERELDPSLLVSSASVGTHPRRNVASIARALPEPR